MSEALFQQALRQHQVGNFGEAARLYGEVLRLNGGHFQALYLLGIVHLQNGGFAEAERLIGEAIRRNPAAPDAHYNRGCALQGLKRYEEAIVCFDRAVALKPGYSDALINRGASLIALGRFAQALESLDRALVISPDDAEGLSNRASALFETKDYAGAASAYDRALRARPDLPYALGNLVLSRFHCCDWRFADTDRAALTAGIKAGKPVVQPQIDAVLARSAEEPWRCARLLVARDCPPSPAPLWRGELYTHDRIRLAYLSADFHLHATALLMAGVFEHHDRERFETTAISFGPDDKSAMRKRLEGSFDRFLDVRGKSDAEVAALLRRMEIDIAIDLKGHTQGGRPGIAALRPAPLQVSYLGFPGSMGADYIDYLIADSIVIPEEQRRWYSEKIVYLPDSYQANSPRMVAPHVPSRSEAGLPENGFIFCSFNNSYKITPEMFGLWMRILHGTENSVLWLLEDSPVATAQLRREAQARGIVPQRLVFAPRTDPQAHLARLGLADLFLDTLPCNAHTTASDALWAGLPLLTCLGTSFAGRVAASLLHAVGLPELITDSPAAYEARALALARDPAALAALKTRLVRTRDRSPLFDTARFTRHLEAAYSGMWRRYRAGERPEHFAVPATA